MNLGESLLGMVVILTVMVYGFALILKGPEPAAKMLRWVFKKAWKLFLNFVGGILKWVGKAFTDLLAAHPYITGVAVLGVILYFLYGR
ncbi:MAG: hypothetical protein Q7R98_01900 [Candidatus Jorgensenbacteria bacterium]|nr:hypothetical protein [Candidatus Jorgensenbacteria bacterium]